MVFGTEYSKILEKLISIDPVNYGKTRNFIDGDVTYLSPYISRGVISLKQVKEAVIEKGHDAYQMERLFQELAWREYYQRVWQAKGESILDEIKHPQTDVIHHSMIAAIEKGSTGIDAIDVGIRKLYETGYMHNHVRMYTASITCNIGKAHWLHPSRWLYYHLIDGDIASNCCNWQWVAGAFAEKKYYCNQENINLFTHTDQRTTFLDKTYEELPLMSVPEVLQATIDLQLKSELPRTELPVIDPDKRTLLYNSYNLDPEWRKTEDVNRILLLEPGHFNKYPVSEKVLSFIINLAKNISGIMIFCGEVNELEALYQDSNRSVNEIFISKEHPAFLHYPGEKDEREWMYPEVSGYHPSFFNYWKKCKRSIR